MAVTRFFLGVHIGLVLSLVALAAGASPVTIVAPTAAAGEEYYVNVREGTQLGWYSLRREINGFRFKFLDTRHNERQGTLPQSDVLFLQSKFLALPVTAKNKSMQRCARRHVQISVTRNGQRQDRDRCLKDLTPEENELLSALQRATTRLE